MGKFHKEISKSNQLNYLGKNAIKDVNNYQWTSRVKKIINFYEKR